MSEWTLDERANIDFVLNLRRRWSDVVYPALADEFAEAGVPPNSAAATESLIHDLPSYAWFAWLERGSQKMLWRAVSDVVAAHDDKVSLPKNPVGRLELDPALELPAWYTDWDIHVQPGGVWRNDRSAQVYELGAKLVMLGENDDYAIHRRFVETALPERSYGRIVDLGCGFGKSTWPFKQAFPDAEVIGLDLAAPCLRLAHMKSEQLGLGIAYLQRDCCATGLPDNSADLVASTMLLHELPLETLEQAIAEAARILAPGGFLRMLDFRNTGEPLRDLAMREHGARNNEPFLPAAMDADTVGMCGRAGLQNAAWTAFDERGDGRLHELAWPRRPEWHFPWAVLEAGKPA